MSSPARNPVGRPPSLSQERILQTALEIPFKKLSMVRLAKELRVSDAALYYYFPTSDALRGAVVNAITQHLPLPARTTNWRVWMKKFALTMYEQLGLHPGSAAFMMAAGPTGTLHYGIMEKALGILTGANFPIKQAWLLYSNVVNLTIEFAQKRDEQNKTKTRTGKSQSDHLVQEILSLPSTDFPLLQKAARIQSKLPADAHFKFGLETLLSFEPSK